MGSGDVRTYACRTSVAQGWTKGVKKGDYFPIHNKKSNDCMTVGGYAGKGVVNLWMCDNSVDQLWKFDGAMYMGL